MRRNFAFASLVPAFKTGLYVFGGLAVHRVLSMALDTFALSKVGALSSGPVAPFRSLIASLLVAAVGVPTAFKVLPARSLEVSGGMAASVLMDVVKVVLQQTGMMDTAGRYLGMSGIPKMNTRGYGSYELNGFGAAPYAQAAAGFGYDPTPVQAMAAAPYAQAAAGYGEYESINGFGEYTLDGIHGDQASAEAALNAADAMATPVQALADVPQVDTEFTPRMPQAAVAGFGAGIFDSTTVLADCLTIAARF